MAKRLEQRELPEGVSVFDFGTGGLDLAYEVMRGYDALILVDTSRQGGEPGTLYVMEPDQEEIKGGFEDGEMINPHGMDPQTVLRFVNAVGGWPGKVVVVACEPLTVEEMGLGLSDRGGGGRGRRHRRGAGAGRGARGARALPEQRGARHRAAPRRRAQGQRGRPDGRRAAPGGAVVAGVLLGDRDAGRPCARARCWTLDLVDARLALRRLRGGVDAGPAGLPLPGCGGSDVEVLAGTEFFVDSIDVEGGGGMHRTRVRVAEEALDANTTIAQANRADFDRESVAVVNLMSAPGAGKTSLLEAVLPRGHGRRARRACWRATCRAASTRTGCRATTCR